ncbi:MAG: SCO family protein [Pseudomonadota bacterium]
MGPRNFVIAFAAGIALAAGIFLALKQSAPQQLRSAFVLPAPEVLPDFALLDQAGEAFTPDSLSGQWDVVFFGFTSCPDICPVTLQKLTLARRQMQEAGIGELPRIVLVSVDPEHDTPDIIGKYVNYFGDGNVGVTGTLEETRKLAKSLYVYFEKVALEDGGYTVDHSPAVLVIDPDGRYHSGFGSSMTAEDYAYDLSILMGVY